MLLLQQQGDLVAVDSQLVDGSVAFVDGVCYFVVEFLVEVVVGVYCAGCEMDVGEGFFEKLAIFFVGDGSSNFAA